MYAIISCGRCRRNRMIDMSDLSSSCPYCGSADDHRKMKIIFEDKDQSNVREVLNRMSGVVVEEKPKRGKDPDPLSTLIYNYEKCKDVLSKMELLSKGLTDIYGTFSMAEIETVDPKNAEKLVKGMLDSGLIYEVRHGTYRG